MADAAVISVVATGTVGVLGAALGALNPWFTRKSQVEERLEGRRNDFRAVLDEAAGVLGAAVATVEQIWLSISSGGLGPWYGSVGDPSRKTSLVQDIRDVRGHSARLGVRLGPSDPIYDSYRRALGGLVELEGSLSDARVAARYAGLSDDMSPEDQERKVIQWIFTCREAIIQSYAAFQESASARMGVPER